MISPRLPLEHMLDKVAACLGKGGGEASKSVGGEREEEGEEEREMMDIAMMMMMTVTMVKTLTQLQWTTSHLILGER